jgi:hypothetical protein
MALIDRRVAHEYTVDCQREECDASGHGGPERDSVPHIPFARKALDGSAAKKVASGQPLPDYEEGYQEWREAYEQKLASIYVVVDAVSVAEKTFQKGIGCK